MNLFLTLKQIFLCRMPSLFACVQYGWMMLPRNESRMLPGGWIEGLSNSTNTFNNSKVSSRNDSR